MAIRTITWEVQEDGMSITPATCQDGGVQGDHNKTRAEFVLPASLIGGYDFYIECVDVVGEWDTTDKLEVENDRVGILLPLAWTQHGGEATLRLVATKEGETGYTLEGRVRYHSRAGVLEKVKALIEGCIQAMLTRTEKAADRIEAAEAALTDGEERVGQAAETADSAKRTAEQALQDAQEAEQRARSVKGVYVGSGKMPEGYNVQIDPTGPAFEMDTELDKNSQSPVSNSAISAAIEEQTAKHNEEIDALDAKFSRTMYGGWAAVGKEGMSKIEADAAVDKQLQAWWDAMPSDSVRFFTLVVNTSESTVAPGNNLVRLYKTVANNLSYGTIETHSYQYTTEGSGLRRSIIANEFKPWEHWGKYQVDTVRVKSTDYPSLYLYSHQSSQSLGEADFGMNITTVDDGVQFSGNVAPHRSTNYVQSMTLGTYANPWTCVYSSNGVTQTSSRDAKENIKNVISELTPMTMSLEDDPVELSDITAEMLVDFVRNLQPVTFNYKGDHSPDAEQLGLIADDIAEHPVYKYVGVDSVADVEVTPAKYDEQGNLVEEAVTEKKRVLGLQAIPLAVTALTTCKHLLNQLDNVYAINEDFQSQLDSINARLSAVEGK